MIRFTGALLMSSRVDNTNRRGFPLMNVTSAFAKNDIVESYKNRVVNYLAVNQPNIYGGIKKKQINF